ncbi:myb-related transcription factor, partner of profilin-like [Tachysurus ichikawai]
MRELGGIQRRATPVKDERHQSRTSDTSQGRATPVKDEQHQSRTSNTSGGKEKTVLQPPEHADGGRSTADLTSVDNKIAAIGEVSVCGIVSEKGDTDVTETTEEQVLPESEAVGEQEVQVVRYSVLQLQRETINAVNRVADELRQMREVMQEIAQSLKDAVKT